MGMLTHCCWGLVRMAHPTDVYFSFDLARSQGEAHKNQLLYIYAIEFPLSTQPAIQLNLHGH